MQGSPESETAVEAAQAAAAVIRRFTAGSTEVREKGLCDLVTDADVEAERAVAEVVRRAHPGHAILGEESLRADVDSEHLWVVDPLDGTSNFAHGIPHYAVSIAYRRAGRTQVGVVLDVPRNELFRAERGAGARHDGRPVRVSPAKRLDEVLVAVGFHYDRGPLMEGTLSALRDLFGQAIHGIRRNGSAALDLCWTGIGRYGAFFEYRLSPWDFAAGELFVEEAGGRVSTCRGEPLPLGTSGVLATNGLLHEDVLRIVRQHHPPDASLV